MQVIYLRHELTDAAAVVCNCELRAVKKQQLLIRDMLTRFFSQFESIDFEYLLIVSPDSMLLLYKRKWRRAKIDRECFLHGPCKELCDAACVISVWSWDSLTLYHHVTVVTHELLFYSLVWIKKNYLYIYKCYEHLVCEDQTVLLYNGGCAFYT